MSHALSPPRARACSGWPPNSLASASRTASAGQAHWGGDRKFKLRSRTTRNPPPPSSRPRTTPSRRPQSPASGYFPPVSRPPDAPIPPQQLRPRVPPATITSPAAIMRTPQPCPPLRLLPQQRGDGDLLEPIAPIGRDAFGRLGPAAPPSSLVTTAAGFAFLHEPARATRWTAQLPPSPQATSRELSPARQSGEGDRRWFRCGCRATGALTTSSGG
jgi:hypothetical protein